jgi:hypothetical protein
MNFEILDAVLAADLQPASLKLAAVVMAVHANRDTGLFWPSVGTLAAKCSLSETQMKRVMAELRKMQLIRKVEGSSGGRRTATSVYEFDLAQLRFAADPGHQGTPSTDGPRPQMDRHPGHWGTSTPATDDTGPRPSVAPKGELKGNGNSLKPRRSASAGSPLGRTPSQRRNPIRTFEPWKTSN